MLRSASLASGNVMPCYAWGMGTAWYGAMGEKGEQMKTSIKMALDNGFFHLDSAQMYRNEVLSGEAIKEWLASNPARSRSDLFVTSKLADSNKEAENVKPSLEQSLRELQVNYLDLFLIHSPFKSNTPIIETWREMERLVDLGFVKDIGVSNFRVSELQEILKDCRIKPSVNQIEYHPFVQNEELIQFCNEQNIIVMSYSGLAPIIYFPGPLDSLLNELAQKYNTCQGHILQKWLLLQNIGIVTTTSKQHRMKDFFTISDVPLSKEDAKKLSNTAASIKKRKYWADVW